jgi:F-type H+-transporting ATPase subunit epsilon
MAATFEVQILTPEETVFAGKAVHLLVPGSEGYLGVLAHHAPLMTALARGKLVVDGADGLERIYHVDGGFLEVSKNSARVLADSLQRDEIVALD